MIFGMVTLERRPNMASTTVTRPAWLEQLNKIMASFVRSERSVSRQFGFIVVRSGDATEVIFYGCNNAPIPAGIRVRIFYEVFPRIKWLPLHTARFQ
jgi:hypothetical protein